jgi:hypothetical protein
MYQYELLKGPNLTLAGVTRRCTFVGFIWQGGGEKAYPRLKMEATRRELKQNEGK